MFKQKHVSRKRFAINVSLAFFIAVFVTGVAITHEGHAPLPSKGVQLDLAKGLVTLSPEAQKSLGVQTTPTELRTLEQQCLAYATLVTPWQRQFFVSSQLSGRIANLYVNSGESVEAGQLLAEIASSELEGIQLEFRNAVNALDLSKRQHERLGGLARDQVIAGREFIEATTKFEQDKIAVQIAASKLTSLGFSDSTIQNLATATEGGHALYLALVSGVGGTVSHSDLSVGKVITANEHLFEINDVSKMWVEIGVLEHDFTRVKVGQPIEIGFTAFPNEPVAASVSVVGNFIDPTTHVATVWAEIENPPAEPKFLPGMYGTARITTSDSAKLLTIPSSSLLGSGAERYVLVEVAATAKGYEYRRQNVVVAAENSAIAQIRDGAIFPGDRVVSQGGHVLSSFFVLGSLRLSPEGISNVGLKIEPVSQQMVSDVISVDGIIDLPPGRVATISSQLTGTIRRVLVDRDQRVSAGQIIAEVGGLPLLDAQLELLRSDRETQLLIGTLQRFNSSGDSQLVATRRIWEAESARDAAANRRQSAWKSLIAMGMIASEVEQVLETGQPRETLPIRSPIDGLVVKFNKVLGESVTPDESIFEVHDLSHVWAKGFLSEKEAAKVRIGAEARVRLPSDSKFLATGRIVRSSRLFGEGNRTLMVWIEFDEPEEQGLRRNLLARIAAAVGEPESALAIPLSAVVREGTRDFVFVQKQDGLIERRNVVLGRSDDRFVAIQSGLNPGEMVAVQGIEELQTTYFSVR